MDLQERIAIKADRNRVFTYLNQVEKRTEYIPMLDEVILLDPPPIRLGSRYTEVATIAGRDLQTTYQVIEWEQDRKVKVKTIKSIFPIAAEMKLSDDNGETIVKLQLSFTLKGIYRLGAPIVRGIVQQQAVDILRKLKKNIEEG
ncbi:MAG: SRPBCC family protein [Saprospiraceae bacterium]|nr:SRPBCC family protein [Saprospiraceae bacterium]